MQAPILPIPETSLTIGGVAELTITEAAARSGYTGRTLRFAIARGHLKARKVGPLWLIAESALVRWKEAGKHTPGPKPRPRP